jgi:dTDP-4-amino-4,6-dideoxygalactose transaminase
MEVSSPSASVARAIPFFDYPSVFRSEETVLLEIIRTVGRRGAFIMQKELAGFERNLAISLGAKHVLGVANATDGLLLALRAAGLGPGDEVIFSSHTMIATAAAIHFAGATPVPVECGRDHLINPQSVRKAITVRSKALLPTHLNGRTCNMDLLQAVADEHGLIIVEDAAQALGSRFKGRCAGTFGIASAISFYPAKVLACLGDGGAVVTNDDDVYERLRQLRDHGRNQSGEVVSWGLNSRLDNIQAAILDFRLKSYENAITRRRAIATLYQQGLSHLRELVLPSPPGAAPDHFDVFQNYEIQADRRDELKRFLQQRGVGTLIQWGGKPVHQCSNLGFTQELPYTDWLFTKLLMLPMNTSLTDEDVRYISSCIREFYRT